MNKYTLAILTVILTLCLIIPACSSSKVDMNLDPDGKQIVVDFTENGVAFTSAHVYIGAFTKGKPVVANVLINNRTGQSIKASLDKVFDVDPENDPILAGKGYVAVPSYYSDWIDIPKTGYIEDGKSAGYAVSLYIPNTITDEIPKKWTFVITFASNTGGLVQVGGGVWVVVDMR